MKFYTITVVSNFLERPLISSFHHSMFHGVSERDGQEWPRPPTVWANTESFAPLEISRTICRVPEIFCPYGDMVVSERLAERLRRFQNIRLAPVVFKRLVDVEWKKGDQSWFEKWGTVASADPCKLLRTLPDVSEFHKQIGAFFEVQGYHLKDILERYPLTEDVTIETRTPPMQESEVISLSPEMVSDYPMLRWGSIIVNEDVFDVLDANLDRDFFIVRKYKLN